MGHVGDVGALAGLVRVEAVGVLDGTIELLGQPEPGRDVGHDRTLPNHARAASAFGTVSSGLTGDQTPSTRPSSSTRNDDRMRPIEVRPARTFSPQAPHASMVEWSG